MQIFFSASTSGAAGTNSKTLKPFRASKGYEGSDANTFELPILKHGLVDVNVEAEENKCMMMKCNTVTIRDGLLYTKYVTCTVVVVHICPLVTKQRPTLTIGRSAHFSLQ